MHLITVRDGQGYSVCALENGKALKLHIDRGLIDDTDPMKSIANSWGDGNMERVALGDVVSDWETDLVAPMRRPSKMIGMVSNYRKHAQEMAAVNGHPDTPSSGGRDYGFFLKAPSSILDPGGTVELPLPDRRTDFEGELCVIVGRKLRRVSPDEAREGVFGYTCGLDITVRGTEDRSVRKSFNTFSPLGRSVVTSDEVGDVNSLRLTTTINGEVRQSEIMGEMIVDVPNALARISEVMTIWPGDVLYTGTPSGVGPLSDGDVIEVTVAGVSTLRVGVRRRG